MGSLRGASSEGQGRRAGLGARRALGQHFLKDQSAIDDIVRRALLPRPEVVVEIGPGKGALSDRLAVGPHETILVEKDSRFVALLRERFAATEGLRVVEGDAADLDFATLLPAGRRAVVVGNLPYNRAAPIYFNLLAQRHFFARFMLMFQREVAERLVASPGSRSYGSPSVVTAVFGAARIVRRLPPGAFAPPPKVHSAVVEFVPRERGDPAESDSPAEEERGMASLRALFAYRRKTLANALSRAVQCSREEAVAMIREVGLDPCSRPEQCSPDLLWALVVPPPT